MFCTTILIFLNENKLRWKWSMHSFPTYVFSQNYVLNNKRLVIKDTLYMSNWVLYFILLCFLVWTLYISVPNLDLSVYLALVRFQAFICMILVTLYSLSCMSVFLVWSLSLDYIILITAIILVSLITLLHTFAFLMAIKINVSNWQ